MKTWTEDATTENPRWTRCRAALGREPKAYEFIVWNSRCWQEFAETLGLRSVDGIHARLKDADVAFDAFQAEGVRCGRWQVR